MWSMSLKRSSTYCQRSLRSGSFREIPHRQQERLAIADFELRRAMRTSQSQEGCLSWWRCRGFPVDPKLCRHACSVARYGWWFWQLGISRSRCAGWVQSIASWPCYLWYCAVHGRQAKERLGACVMQVDTATGVVHGGEIVKDSSGRRSRSGGRRVTQSSCALTLSRIRTLDSPQCLSLACFQHDWKVIEWSKQCILLEIPVLQKINPLVLTLALSLFYRYSETLSQRGAGNNADGTGHQSE